MCLPTGLNSEDFGWNKMLLRADLPQHIGQEGDTLTSWYAVAFRTDCVTPPIYLD